MNKTVSYCMSIVLATVLALGAFTPGKAKSNYTESNSEKADNLSVGRELQVVLPQIVVDADSRVHEAKPTTNYGTYGSVLYVEGGGDPDIESYFRFTVTGISGTVASAKFLVYVTEGTVNGPSIYTTGNEWTETGITWDNRPARTSGVLDDKGSLGSNIWVEYDVTSKITGNGTYSFVLATDSTDSLSLSSREGSFPAQLVITVNDTQTNTAPTSTLQVAPSLTPTLIQPSNTPLPPTITPTVAVNTATQAATNTPTQIATALATSTPTRSVTNTATPTKVIQPSPTVTFAPVNVPINSGGMWIASSELMSLPTSGTAWDKIKSTAYGSWGTADLKNQDNKHAINTLAGALVYARTGDAALRSKVRDAILAAKRTLDESSEWQTTNGVLATGRQLGAYVISADLIGLKSYDTASDNEFRAWLTTVRTTNIGTHGRWKNLVYTCENSSNNWGTFSCASRIAASIYLGDSADVQRSAAIIRAYFGERSYYPSNAPGSNGYFEKTSSYLSSWACNDTTWLALNPSCTKSGANIDGVLLEDASRGGGCCVLQGPGISYSWEALQGLFVSAELLHRTGSYDPYNWSNQALKRAMDFMQRSGWGITGPATYVPWMANFRYNTSYTTTSVTGGRIMSWGDWLYHR